MKVLIGPTDFRSSGVFRPAAGPPWADSLYASLREELRQFPKVR
jgi:hypothetical protein